MAITSSIDVTPYAQTALMKVSYDLDGYGDNFTIRLGLLRPDIWESTGPTFGNAIQTYRFRLINNGSGYFTFIIYPLPADTVVNCYLEFYNTSTSQLIHSHYNITFRTLSMSTDAKYIVMPKVTPYTPAGAPKMSEADKQYNARIFYNVLSADQWSDSAVSSILAFAEYFGDLNPMSKMKCGMPYALDEKPNGWWPRYMGGTLYDYDYYYPMFGYFGAFYRSSVRPIHSADNSFIGSYDYTENFGEGTSVFIQYSRVYNDGMNGMNTFLPTYKQHLIDVIDRYSGHSWYDRTNAFSLEQYIEYLILYKQHENDYDVLNVFNENSVITDFLTFTVSEENASQLVQDLYDSFQKSRMYEGYTDPSYPSYIRLSDASYIPYTMLRNNANIIKPILAALAKKWYDYIQSIKPKPKKRKGMPIWEYLRYTI